MVCGVKVLTEIRVKMCGMFGIRVENEPHAYTMSILTDDVISTRNQTRMFGDRWSLPSADLVFDEIIPQNGSLNEIYFIGCFFFGICLLG